MQTDYLKEIKRLVTVSDIAQRYGIDTNDKGFTKCLFHSEKTASMKIYPDSRGFYCFGCGVGGDCIDFVSKLFELSTYKAAQKINSDFGLNLPIDGRKLSYKEREELNRRLYEQRKKRQQAENERQELLKAWIDAYSLWIAYERIKRDLRPKSPEEEPSKLWLWAIKNLDRAEAELEDVETRRWKYEKGRR